MASSYDALIRAFRWQVPERLNIATVCCDCWAAKEPERPAILTWRGAGRELATTGFGELKHGSDRLAGALRGRGIGRGDRVAIILPQSVETVLAHFAIYKLGAIAVPLAALFGSDALRFRLSDSGCRAVITDGAGARRLATLASHLPALATVLCTDGDAGGAGDFHRAIAEARPLEEPAATGPDTPALIIYTSGTTGPPKGAVHGHRVLGGHLPGMAFTHHPFPSAGDRLWTPADWAWAGGLLNALLPALARGVPVVAGLFGKFDPEAAFGLMAEAGVRNAFLPPTALKLMRAIERPRERFRFWLRTIGTAGESLGRGAFEWAREALGVAANEFYGQTECNYVLGSSAAFGVSRAGAIGRPLPGHEVAVLDANGRPAQPGGAGEIAVRAPDPVMFLGYWNQPEATAAKFRGDWLLTGDEGVVDGDGYVHFVGRRDDVIISSGYRIGPSEVEDCLLAHPAVAMAAAVGKPDPVRTEIVKAFVVLKPGISPSPDLVADLQQVVRSRLSAAEYPREIAFVEDIPLTTSGKVIRRHFRDAVRAEAAARSDQPLSR